MYAIKSRSKEAQKLFLTITVLFAGIVLVGCSKDPNDKENGREGVLWRADRTTIPVGIDKRAAEMAYGVAKVEGTYKWDYTISEEDATGRLLYVPRKIRVCQIERDSIFCKVQIMEGEYVGQIGWVPSVWVEWKRR